MRRTRWTSSAWVMKSACSAPTARQTKRPNGSAAPMAAGSKSDWETMKNAADTLDKLGVGYEKRVLSAHRTPDQTAEWVSGADGRGIKVRLGNDEECGGHAGQARRGL